jgi:hypothetical protein
MGQEEHRCDATPRRSAIRTDRQCHRTARTRSRSKHRRRFRADCTPRCSHARNNRLNISSDCSCRQMRGVQRKLLKFTVVNEYRSENCILICLLCTVASILCHCHSVCLDRGVFNLGRILVLLSSTGGANVVRLMRLRVLIDVVQLPLYRASFASVMG